MKTFILGATPIMAFMELNDGEGVSTDFDAGINRGLGTGAGVYHFAFKVGSPEELEQKRSELEAKDVKTRGIVDHGWCQSVYFRDPNFLQLEFCCLSKELGEENLTGRASEAWKRLARR